MTTECTTGLQNGHMRAFLPFFKWNVRNKVHDSSKTVTRKHGLFATISVFLHDWYYLAVPHVTFLPIFLLLETSDYATRGFSETQNWSNFLHLSRSPKPSPERASVGFSPFPPAACQHEHINKSQTNSSKYLPPQISQNTGKSTIQVLQELTRC
jgi:hypothetical protein